MKPFTYLRGSSLQAARGELSAGHRPLAGGTDLLPLLKSGIIETQSLVDIKSAQLPQGIEEDEHGVHIGALTTLTEIARSQLLQERFALLVQAAQLTATRQIRNRATLGGNLLQRTRCWYFRNSRVSCWLNGGTICLAAEGRNEQHALYGDSPCKAVHPSDLAGCLLALDARVTLLGGNGRRAVPLRNFFALPEPERRRETVIEDDELLLSIDIPAHPGDWKSLYLKAMDRKVWAFALAGIAVAVRKSAGNIADIRIVANGVAPIPWRLPESEAQLQGGPGDARAITAAVEAVGAGAEPLSDNGYKLDLTRCLLREALEKLLAEQ